MVKVHEHKWKAVHGTRGNVPFVKETCHECGASRVAYKMNEVLKLEVPFYCFVCGKEFPSLKELSEHVWDLWDNDDGSTSGTLKPDHDKKTREWHSGQPCVICGGRVVTRGHGEDSWSTECMNCRFLYDED